MRAQLLNMALYSEHAKLVVSLLQEVHEKDQRLTMLQLVDKMKIVQKELGMSYDLKIVIFTLM